MWESEIMGEGLPREFVRVDAKGRVTIPKRFRKALGIESKAVVIIEAYPSLEEIKTLIIKKIG